MLNSEMWGRGWRRAAFLALVIGCLMLRGSYVEKTAVGTSTYGEVYASNNGAATVIALVNTWYQFTDFTAVGDFNNTTPSIATDDITILADGDYYVAASISVAGTPNNAFELQIQKNGGTVVYPDLLAEHFMNAAGTVCTLEISGIADLVATDTVELWIRNTTAGNNATLEQVNLSLHIMILGAGGGGGGGGGSTITAGTFAALPACTTSGDMYLFSDSGYEHAFCDGSSWHYYRDGKEMVPPVLGSFGWINQGGATASTTYGGIYLVAPAQAGTSVRLLVKAAPATPYTVDVVVLNGWQAQNAPSICAIFRESGTQEIEGICAGFNSNERLLIMRYDNPTSYNSMPLTYNMRGLAPNKVILRIEDDGTNRKLYYSLEGSQWILIRSHLRTDFLTADQIGISVESANGTWGAQARFLSFHEQ